MKKLLSFAIALLSCLQSQGQPSCETDKLSQQDKGLLQQFVNEFKEALNNQDKNQLEALVRFPFSCSYCIIDSTEEKNRPYINVTRKQFLGSQYQVFFTPYLVEEINKKDLFDVLGVEDTESGQSCTYFFSYPIMKPTKTWEGLQGFFSIRNINGKYKIVAAWTVP